MTYFEWLINLVGGDEWWGAYTLQLCRLYDRKYYFVNKLDSAMYDGSTSLRTDAIFDDVDVLSIPNDEPSVLELLVYLARQIDLHLMYTGEEDARTPRWFDDLMTELGFKIDGDLVDHQIDTFLEGTNTIIKKIRGKRPKRYYFTLWEQVNMYYMKQFDLETDDI